MTRKALVGRVRDLPDRPGRFQTRPTEIQTLYPRQFVRFLAEEGDALLERGHVPLVFVLDGDGTLEALLLEHGQHVGGAAGAGAPGYVMEAAGILTRHQVLEVQRKNLVAVEF